MGLFSSKKEESDSLIQNLRAENSKLKEDLMLMASIRNANDELKKKLQETNELKRDKEHLIQIISRTLIEKGMDEKIVKVFDYDPIMLFNKLIERFELIDKLSCIEIDSISKEQEPNVLSYEKVVEDNGNTLSEENLCLQQKLGRLTEEYANKEHSLTEQISCLEYDKAQLNERIKQLQLDLENSQAEAKEKMELLSASKNQEIKDAVTENSVKYQNQLNDIQRQLTGEYEAKIADIKNNVGPSIEEQVSLIKVQVIEQMQKVLDTLFQVDYIVSCNGDNTETEIMQDNIRNGARKTLEGLANIDITKSTSLTQAHTKIQEFLLNEMEPISCWMRKLAIYSAYANIPFMIDEGRTDGIRFNREATMWSYALLDDMLAGVGIKQIVPAPFIELISDGAYEDASDSATKNIGTFCPDYIQRLDRIDRIDKAGIIIDIADVGLMIDGQLYRQAKVII